MLWLYFKCCVSLVLCISMLWLDPFHMLFLSYVVFVLCWCCGCVSSVVYFSVVYFSVVVRFLAQRLPHLPRDHTDNLSTYLLSLMSNPELSFTFFSCYFYFYFWFEVYDINIVQSLHSMHRIWFWFCLLFRSQQWEGEISQAIQSELMFSFTTELQPGWLGAV